MSTTLIRIVPGPQTLTAGDNAVPFGHPVTRYLVRNNSGVIIYVAADTTASTFSTPVLHGRQLLVDAPVSVLHLYTPNTASVDDYGLGDIEVAGWAAQDIVPAGTPVLQGPYVVNYTDIPHDGDVKTLWTPQVGDVLLRLFVDWKTVVQWNHGTISLGPNVDGAGNVNIITGAIAGQIASSIRTYGVLDSVLDAGFEQNNDDAGNPFYSSAWVFHTTDPVQIQLTGTGGADPTAGHVELYALIARAVAP